MPGIGGVFFRAGDPRSPETWYLDNPGVPLTPRDDSVPPWQQQPGPTVSAPYPDGRFARVYDPEGNAVELRDLK